MFLGHKYVFNNECFRKTRLHIDSFKAVVSSKNPYLRCGRCVDLPAEDSVFPQFITDLIGFLNHQG